MTLSEIDIKSEEEKRQEMQNAISLLSTGVPVSVLIDYGLAESTVDALVQGDIGTVEKVGSMTPEDLEAIPGIDGQAVAHIQQAINSYYGQEYAAEAPAQEESAGGADETFEDQEGVETPVEPVTEMLTDTSSVESFPEASAAALQPETGEMEEDLSSATIVEPAEQG